MYQATTGSPLEPTDRLKPFLFLGNCVPARSPLLTTRRRVLQTLSSAGVVGSAGCVVGDGHESDSPDETGTSAPDRWTELTLSSETTSTDDPEWRMLGHDTGNTFHNPHAEGPSDDPTVRWTVGGSTDTSFSGYVHHQPLIVDGTVYTTIEQAGTDDERWAFVAVDSDIGETDPIFETDDPLWRPTIIDNTVYLAVGAAVAAYDLTDGTERWRTDPLRGEPSSIRRVDDVVVALIGTQLYDVSNGTLEPFPQLFVFDAETGETLWEGPGDGSDADQPRLPIVADGGVLYPNTNSFRDLRTGEVLATLPSTHYPVLRDGEYYGSEDGGLVSYDWETMSPRWEYRPADRVIGGGWASVAGDIVILDDVRGPGFVGLDRTTGERLWTTELWEEGLGTIFWASTETTVYTAHDGGAAAALDVADGTVRWRINTDEMEWGLGSGCALADDLWVTVGRDHTLFTLS